MKEDNILLANFLGWKRYETFNFVTDHYQDYLSVGDGICQTSVFREEDLLFHKKWDWIMPVIEKINSITTEGGALYRGVRITYDAAYLTVKNANFTQAIGKGDNYCDTLIECVYKLAVEFIKWHNNENRNRNKKNS